MADIRSFRVRKVQKAQVDLHFHSTCIIFATKCEDRLQLSSPNYIYKDIKRKRKIQVILGVAVLLVFGFSTLLNSPRVQQRISVLLATELENHIGTRVDLGGVYWLFPNDLVIDSLTIDDQEGEHLFSANRIAAKFEWKSLIKRKLSIRNIRIFYPEINIYKENYEATPNYQFLIDAFATNEKKELPALDLRINSLLIRHAEFSYNILSEAQNPQRFNPHHIDIDDLSTHLSLKTFTSDSISCAVRELSFREQSGMQVNDLYLRFVGNHQGATLANLRLELPQSALRLDTIWASYSPDNFKESLFVKGGIQPSHITPGDFSFLSPEIRGLKDEIHLSGLFYGNLQDFNVNDFFVYSDDYSLSLKANATANLQELSQEAIDIELQEASWGPQTWTTLEAQLPDIYGTIPQELIRIGKVKAKGTAHLSKGSNKIDLQANTDAGNLIANVSIDNKGTYAANIKGAAINVEKILPTSPLTSTNITLQAKGRYDANATDTPLPLRGTIYGEATMANLLGYEYQSIRLEGEYSPEKAEADINIYDPNARIVLEAKYQQGERMPRYDIDLKADSVDLHALKLIDIHEGKSFSTCLAGVLHGNDLDHLIGKIEIDNITMHRGEDDYNTGEVIIASNEIEKKSISISSQFLDANFVTDFDYKDLVANLSDHIRRYLPSLNSTKTALASNTDYKDCYVQLWVRDAAPFRELLLLPISIDRLIEAKAMLQTLPHESWASIKANHINYNGHNFNPLTLDYRANADNCILELGGTRRATDGTNITAGIKATASNDSIDLSAQWKSNTDGLFEGTFSASAELWNNAENELAIHIKSDKSNATIKEAAWVLHPFDVYLSPKSTTIEGLHFAQGEAQYLDIDGSIANTTTDTLNVKLNNVDLSYLISMTNLKGISFGGKMSGHIDAAALYSPTPYLDAQISAKDFSFCQGTMGDALVDAHWNQEESQLDFNVDITEKQQHTTNIAGEVDIADNELWLDITADSTNISFLNTLLGTFMSDIKGSAKGHILLGGKLDSLDIQGAILAEADLRLIPTQATYTFKDSIYFTPGKIHFKELTIRDYRGEKGKVNGVVTHSRINHFAFNLNIEADNITGIDLPDTGSDSFYTTIYGTGYISVKGGPRQPLDIDITAHPEPESIFALNLLEQNITSSEAFLTFHDRNSKRNTVSNLEQPLRIRRDGTEVMPLHLDISANITPDAKLKLIMNQAADDHISVNGNGDLNIKVVDDDVKLFGRYTIKRGSYNLSLQNLINKKFDVLEGSFVNFDGDPMSAKLDITARHIVSQAPLKDLSPELTGNVQVNCLLRITNTLNDPILSFELELPRATEEERAILRSYTSTEEQRNLQFIYLLSTSRFYTQDISQNGQGAGMESLFSSTISGQINNLLTNIIDNDNWNFSSNIRTDNLLGESTTDLRDNMEIEGMLEGRLLNNRLLINGNLGYRDNPIYATNFIGDFDARYLLFNGFSVRGYNKTNDRYFTKTSLNTWGVGLIYQQDFEHLPFPTFSRKEITTKEKTRKEKSRKVRKHSSKKNK